MAESIDVSGESTEPITADNSIFCDPCSEEGNNITANGYCMVCDEYLCDTCYSHHCKPRPSRHHVLQDATNMPKQRPGPRSSDAAKFKCHLLHPDKVISSYCKSHDQLCCENCILIGHSACDEVKKVDVLATDISNNEEFKEFEKNLMAVEMQHGENKQLAESHLKLIDKVYDDIMDKFKKRLDEMKSKFVNKMTTIINSCDTAHRQLSVWKSDKDKFHNNQQNGQLYVFMKMTKKPLDMTKNNIERLANDNKKIGYHFVQEETNDNVLVNIVKTPCLVKKIDVKHSSETNTCSLRDIALLGGDLMLVTEDGNNTIKLINTSSNTILSHTKLSSMPYEMTVTDNNQVYVTQPKASKLLHLTSPTVGVRTTREIPVDGECYTVKYLDQKLKVQCYSPCKQIETDMNGKVLRTIHQDISTVKTNNAETFVSNPIHSVLNEKTGSMIASCWANNSITEISDNGNVELLVKSDKLQRPHGLVMDTDGSLLVCSEYGKSVFRVTGTGGIQDNVLPEPLPFKPRALALDKTTRRLYVGGDHNSLLVYQL